MNQKKLTQEQIYELFKRYRGYYPGEKPLSKAESLGLEKLELGVEEQRRGLEITPTETRRGILDSLGTEYLRGETLKPHEITGLRGAGGYLPTIKPLTPTQKFLTPEQQAELARRELPEEKIEYQKELKRAIISKDVLDRIEELVQRKLNFRFTKEDLNQPRIKALKGTDDEVFEGDLKHMSEYLPTERYIFNKLYESMISDYRKGVPLESLGLQGGLTGRGLFPEIESGGLLGKQTEEAEYLDIPAGAKSTGRTRGGKPVYVLPDGNYWIQN